MGMQLCAASPAQKGVAQCTLAQPSHTADPIRSPLQATERPSRPKLLVEQFAAAALEIADYAYVMEAGRIVLEGSASSLRNDPAVRNAYLGKSD